MTPPFFVCLELELDEEEEEEEEAAPGRRPGPGGPRGYT